MPAGPERHAARPARRRRTKGPAPPACATDSGASVRGAAARLLRRVGGRAERALVRCSQGPGPCGTPVPWSCFGHRECFASVAALPAFPFATTGGATRCRRAGLLHGRRGFALPLHICRAGAAVLSIDTSPKAHSYRRLLS
eukprot:scaffold7851_cov323-Prasinococcus_capsulatus_cf.AAC.3